MEEVSCLPLEGSLVPVEAETTEEAVTGKCVHVLLKVQRAHTHTHACADVAGPLLNLTLKSEKLTQGGRSGKR